MEPGQPFITQTPSAPRPVYPPPQGTQQDAAKQLLGFMNTIYEKLVQLEGRVGGFEIMMSKLIEEVESQGDAVMTFNEAIQKVAEKTKGSGQPATFADFLTALEDVYRAAAADQGFQVPSGVDSAAPGNGFQVPSGIEAPVVQAP